MLKLIFIVFILMINTNLFAKNISSFNLLLTHVETEWLYDTKKVDTRLSSISIYRTEPLTEKLEGSIILGFQEQVQDKNVITAARYAAGYFAGFSINYDLLKTTNFRLKINSQYQFHQLEAQEVKQRVSTNWYDISIGLENYYSITNSVQFTFDIQYEELSGTQNAREPISQTISFKNNTTLNYAAGLSYQVSAKGYIAFKLIEGSYQGFRIYFGNNF